MEKAFAKDTSAIMQRWNLDCMHRLAVSKGRIDNSESPLLNGLYLITEVHREVVVPRFTCVLKYGSDACAINIDKNGDWKGISFQQS